LPARDAVNTGEQENMSILVVVRDPVSACDEEEDTPVSLSSCNEGVSTKH
jgi:hypothetical protein